MASRDRELQTMRGALANGLPDEIVLRIITRLPWPAKARCRCVSRAWNHALLHSRRPFLLVEKLMADYGPACSHDWRLLDPLSLQCTHIVKDDIFYVHPLTASAASRDAIFIHFIHHSAHLSWLNFDRMQWTMLPSPHEFPDNFMNPGATSFGAAIIDGYMYIAGGGSNRIERLKLGDHAGNPASSWSWEYLPYMHECRRSPKALVLGGCLYVIGGTTHDHMSVNSGEVWDPRRGQWTLIPELWPCDVFGKLFAPPNAVVARERLYAITNLTRDIMYYEPTTKVWKNLCSLSTFDHIDFGAFPVAHSLVAVGDELWVAVNTQAFVRGLEKVFTTMVTPAGTDPHVPPSWKLLPTVDNIRYTSLVVHL